MGTWITDCRTPYFTDQPNLVNDALDIHLLSSIILYPNPPVSQGIRVKKSAITNISSTVYIEESRPSV